jgi:hypothetical protein
MELLLESARESSTRKPDEHGWVADRSLEEWTAAYGKVEKYLRALGIRNKVFLGQLVLYVLKSATRQAAHEPQVSATDIAMRELDRMLLDWFAQITPDATGTNEDALSTRGRLALLLADMPSKWQDQFLRPGPWPEEFVTAMRETFLHAGPDFQRGRMPPRPLDLGPVTTLANLSRRPYFKLAAISAWLAFGVILVLVFMSRIRL